MKIAMNRSYQQMYPKYRLRLHRRGYGFTFVETLAATLLLAVCAVTLCGLAGRAASQHHRSLAYEQAWSLLEQTMIRHTTDLPADPAEQPLLEGTFAPDHPDYRYEVIFNRTDMADLLKVTVRVFWTPDRQERTVEAHTLVYHDAL